MEGTEALKGVEPAASGPNCKCFITVYTQAVVREQFCCSCHQNREVATLAGKFGRIRLLNLRLFLPVLSYGTLDGGFHLNC